MASIGKKGKKWFVDYRIGGVRRRPQFLTKEEAQRFKRELELRKVNRATGYTSIQETTIIDGCDFYFENESKKPNRSKKQINADGRMLHELDEYLSKLGLDFLDEVELTHMQSFQMTDSKRKKKCRHGEGDQVDPNTVNRKFDFYHHVFERFRAWKFVHDNPMKDLNRLPKIQKPKKIWTEELVGQVLNRVQPWIADIYWFMAMTGCRAGAACMLNFSDWNFDQRTINLRSRKGKDAAEKIYHAPMTKSLYEFGLEYVQKAKAVGTYGHQEPFFRNVRGDRVTSNHLTTEMWRTLRILGVEGYKLHGLRDTFCTMVANSGGIHRAKLLAGHSDIKTTQIYYREDNNDLIETADVIPFQRREVSGI